MNQKIGIVIVSYNASAAVRTTLASLRHARNETPVRVLVIDNASVDMEREKIRSAFERHVKEASLPWEYMQQERNLGFAGGNNLGIRRLLEDPEISNICLLNSDVIVTDHWLDHLVAARCDIISAVTNKADSEQCVPVDYSLEIDQCLDERTESIPAGPLARIQAFAHDWYEAWAGNLVEADVTFFCVLLAKPVFHRVGLLDETFFPGGYEDNDFCLRARKLGYRVHLARDIFIHHWGSASFGQLQYDYFNSRAQRNRDYLEKKHGINLQRRPDKLFISYLMDLKFACSQDKNKVRQQRFNDLYITQLGAALENFESEFRNLCHLLTSSSQEMTPTLKEQIEKAIGFGDLTDAWQRIVSEIEIIWTRHYRPRVSVDELVKQLEHLAEGVRLRVECNFAMHALLILPRKNSDQELLTAVSELTKVLPVAEKSRLSRLLWMLKRGVLFLWNLKGIVFFGGYPYPERQGDGYFQRIQLVDGLFLDRWRVYVESDELPGRNRWFDRPQQRVLVLRILGGTFRRTIVRTLALIATLRCRKIYFHSVLRMRDNRFGHLMYVPGLTKLIDIHGVVPEEFRLHNDFYSAVLYEREERLAVRKSDMVIVVTEAMQNYLRQKYREDLRGQVAIFPMFPNVAPTLASREYVDGKPVVVYAGGLQKWQQVPKMIDAITRTVSICAHRFYCADPDAVRAMLPEAAHLQVIIESKTHEELIGLYAECHYGFILREDIVVNHVACPTKLVEYLAMGIIPVVDCENMGDFRAMGMQFVTLNELLRGSLPDEACRAEMAQRNFIIYERLREMHKHGTRDIYAMLAGDRPSWTSGLDLLLTRAKRLLSPDTQLGRLAHFLRRPLSLASSGIVVDASTPVRNMSEATAVADASIPTECDVLVQVDNFQEGGLENVVLDVSDTLIGAGYKVVLLVLGRAGAGVQRAHKRGMAVVIGSSEAKPYQTLINRLKPRLLLTHYSFHGAEFCHKQGIPFVQVIHNTYMWFDDVQRAAFARAARFTAVFVAVSEYTKRYSIRRLGIDEAHCIVIPNGIDSAAFDAFDRHEARRQIRTKHGLHDHDFVFLSVGSINHQKNHIATVRAFTAAAEHLPGAKLVILGPASEKSLLEEINHFVAAGTLRERIIYAGATPGAYEYYTMADAFVSAAFFEGGPLNQMEAVKANLPSVMSNVGFAGHFEGLPGFEIIDAPLDIAAFRGTIWQLVSTPAFEKRLASAMLRIYRSRRRPDLAPEMLTAFDKSNSYQCYVELIEDLLQGNSVCGRWFAASWPNRLSTASDAPGQHIAASLP